mmetsp:Transcript_22639/g.37012  ORF Transcript_22639/g.37012 Transcript_22639/m.37012 type:complete len:125 (+) Transcript_22639:34-408(+)
MEQKVKEVVPVVLETLVSKEQRAYLEFKAYRVKRDRLLLRLLVLRVIKDSLDLQETLECVGTLEVLDHRDLKETKVQMELRDRLEKEERRELWALLLGVPQEIKVKRVCLDRRDNQLQLAKLAN